MATTVGISEQLHGRLKAEIKTLSKQRYEESIALSKAENKPVRLKEKDFEIGVGEYVETVISFFVKNHLNPFEVEKNLDLTKEVQLLRRHIFGFMKTQEMSYIIPMKDAMDKLHNNVIYVAEMNEKMEKEMIKFKILQNLQLNASIQLSDQEPQYIEKLIAEIQKRFEEQVNESFVKLKDNGN
jgi:hypothetical protein